MNISAISENTNYKNVMEYLIKKLEARSRYMQKVKSATNSIGSFEDFKENKRDMIKQFSEIEDDLNQGANAIKALILQNKDLTEQMQQNNQKMKINDSRLLAEMKMMQEINDKNNLILQENEKLRKYLDDKINYINELEGVIMKLEDQCNNILKENDFLMKNNNDIKIELEKIREENILLKMQVDYSKRDEKISLKNIVDEREKNKKKISEKIKNHLKDKTTDKSVINKADLIMRISNSVDSLNYLNNILGNNFMNSLLNDNVSEDFLKEVKNELENYELSKENYNFNELVNESNEIREKKNFLHHDLINEENEEDEVSERERYENLNLSKGKLNTKTLKKSKSASSINPKKSSNFQQSLRQYNNTGVKKVFKSKFAPGKFFDEGISYGGVSKLDNLDKNIKKARINKSCEK